MDDVIGGFLDAVASVDPLLRTIVAGIAMLLETSVLLGLVVPGDTIVIVAALAVEAWPWWLALIGAIVLGALAGESIGFAIGHWLGPKIDVWLARRWPRASAQWRRTERYLARRGGPAIFLSRFLPVAHSLVPLIVGASAMPYRRFLAWTTPACIVWAAAYASAGWLAGGTYRELADRLHGAGYVMVAVVAAFILLVWVAKRLIGRYEARHMEEGAHEDAEAGQAAEQERGGEPVDEQGSNERVTDRLPNDDR
ncbi:DedA family protein [Agrococcus sp. 1P02AA]|uniref:DedA family protein n=1 Tax=Agrococcus sp. 1P02AA TaxID=3132259 RepID=UPI0039A56A02